MQWTERTQRTRVRVARLALAAVRLAKAAATALGDRQRGGGQRARALAAAWLLARANSPRARRRSLRRSVRRQRQALPNAPASVLRERLEC